MQAQPHGEVAHERVDAHVQHAYVEVEHEVADDHVEVQRSMEDELAYAREQVEQQFELGERAVLHGLVQSPECNGTEVVVVDYREVNRKYRVLFKEGYQIVEWKHLQKVEVGCYTHGLDQVCLEGQMLKEQTSEGGRPSGHKGLEAKATRGAKEHGGA